MYKFAKDFAVGFFAIQAAGTAVMTVARKLAEKKEAKNIEREQCELEQYREDKALLKDAMSLTPHFSIDSATLERIQKNHEKQEAKNVSEVTPIRP